MKRSDGGKSREPAPLIGRHVCTYCGVAEDSLYWDGQEGVVACQACAFERMMFSYLGRAGDAASQARVRQWSEQCVATAAKPAAVIDASSDAG